MPNLEAAAGIPVDLSALSRKFSNDDKPFVLRRDSAVEHIFSELYQVPVKIRTEYFRIKVLELLIYLSALELSDNPEFQSYRENQGGAGICCQGSAEKLYCGESGSGKTTLTRLINGLIPRYYEGQLEGSVIYCVLCWENRRYLWLPMTRN